MQHIMVDLETLGKRAGCRVLSVGLVRMEDEASAQINLELEAQKAAGLHDDPDTIQWWHSQEALEPGLWAQVTSNPVAVRHALEYIANWIKAAGGSDFCIWGYGAGFDMPILKELYARFEVPLPWQHWQEMCARTVRMLSGVDTEAHRVLPKHNPLNDALTQSRWMKAGMVTLLGRIQG